MAGVDADGEAKAEAAVADAVDAEAAADAKFRSGCGDFARRGVLTESRRKQETH